MSENGRLLRWAPWFAGVCLLASLAAAGWAFLRDHDIQRSVERNHALIVTCERLLSSLKDIELGERGFAITGRNAYLEPYEAGTAALPADRQRVATLAGADAERLLQLTAERTEGAAATIATYRRDGAAAALAAIDAGAGKRLMDQVRGEVARLQREADERTDGLADDQRLDDRLQIASLLGLAVSCTMLWLLAKLRRRQQQASQRLFEGVLEHAPIGLGILDRSLRIRHINQALARISARALGVAPGMSIWDVIPQMRATLEPRLNRVMQGGRAASTEVEAASMTRSDQLRSYEATFYPLRHSDGATVEGVGMVIADVTARRRAERATRESEERFRSLVQASVSMIWTADATGAFAQPQPSWTRFTGQPDEESLGWGRTACIHRDDLDRTREAWLAATASPSPFALEHRVRRADGEWRHMALCVAPVLQEDGGLREWIGSHTDITNRKEAEFALAAAKNAAESASRAKSSFLANMSHELRTPLSAVIGYSEMLEEEAEEKGEPSTLADLGKIKTNAKHLLGLINDVLDLSKIEANKMDLLAEDIAVEPFLRDAAGTVSALIGRKANTLVIEIGDNAGTLHTDVVKLRQCLFNLLSNAAKFTQDGTITLSVRRQASPDGDWIAFAVRDTGIGMTPDQLARLFQRFTQADETTTRRFGGTGLGLALSRAFAQLLGGDIAVESAEGVGTCFTLRVSAMLPEIRDAPGGEPRGGDTLGSRRQPASPA